MNDLSNLTDAELDHEMLERALADVKERSAKQLHRAADSLDAAGAELTALRKLRKAVSKMLLYARRDGVTVVHPRDWQQVATFLEEAEKAEVRHVGDDPHV